MFYYRGLGIVTALAFSTRFYNISVPSSVCWDETHFGSMASSYFNRTYFVDVHPPLAKMMIALSGLLTGFDGKFEFRPGQNYITAERSIDFIGMRVLCAACGSLVIPLMYSTVEIMTRSKGAALITSGLLILDCGLITLSQYILLDPILFFFMAATLYCTVKHSVLIQSHRQNRRIDRTSLTSKLSVKCNLKESNANKMISFSLHWWMFLALSGVCLGCMLSVKWVGIFTAVFVGCWTIGDLQYVLNFKKFTKMDFMKHFLARTICLIFIPIYIYTAIFAVHYFILNESGDADAFHSSEFQTCLKGNKLYNASMPRNIAYGSAITLKYHKPGYSGLLHSHNSLYPVEVAATPQRQVTLYMYPDQDNYWEVLKPNSSKGEERNETDLLKYGDIFRLRHIHTRHFLHSCALPSPISNNKQIVSCNNEITDENKSNELWKLEIIKSNGDNRNRIEIISSKFRIIHVNSGCVLQSSFKILPEWGNKQYEVVCSHDTQDKQNSLWNVELTYHRHLEKENIGICQMKFLERFIESHLLMAMSNANIKPKKGEKISKVWHWPINYQGQVFSYMGEDDLRIYLLGNPLIYLINLLVLFVSPAFSTILHLIELRELNRIKSSSCVPLPRNLPGMQLRSKLIKSNINHISSCKWFLFGWIINYAPFLFMSRALYFHHYYIAFIFSCCLSGTFLDMIFKNCAISVSKFCPDWISPSKVQVVIYVFFGLLLLKSFYLYSPLCYGMTGPFSYQKGSMMYGLKLFDHWEI